MRERVELLVGRRARAMWVMTFHSACARMLRADAERLGYTRGFTIYDEQDSLRLVKNCVEELDIDPKRFPARGIRRQISDAKNALLDAEGYRLKVGSFFEQTAADVYDLYEPRLHSAQRDGLRRPAVPLREPVRAVRRGARPLPALLPARAGRRVPGHQPRPVPLAPAALRGAPQPRVVGDDDQSIYALPRRRHPQHPRLRGPLPGRDGGQARAELPLDADDPERLQRGDRQQPLAQGQVALVRARRGRSGARARAGGRARRGALRRVGDRAAGGRGRLARRHRGLLPGQRPEPRARGHAGALRRRLSGHRRHPLLRARGDQGRDGLPHPARQPVGHGRVRAGRQLPAAGDRADLAGAPGRARQHDRRAGVGGRCVARERAGPGHGGGQGGRPLHVGDGAAARARRRRGGGGRPAGRDARGDRLHRGAAGRAHDRVAGAAGEPRGAGRRGARVRRHGRGAVGGGVPPADRALLRAGQPARRAGPGHADDAAQRQGPGVRHGVHHRDGGRRVPALARDRGGRPRGGAPARLRRHHAGQARAVPDLRAHARAVRQPRLEPAQPLHRRDPDRAHRPRGAGPGGPRGRLHVERRRHRRRLRPSRRGRARSSASATT